MKHTYLLLLALLLIAASYHEGESISFNGYEHNITSVIQDAVIIDTEYERVIIRDGSCKVIDTHIWCVESLTFDEVEYYPNEYEINISRQAACENNECKAYGQACETNIQCNGYCVHEICRPQQTWCGDSICDENENCQQDCPEQIEEKKNQTTQTQQNSTQENSTQENTTEENTTQEVIVEPEPETTLSQPTPSTPSVSKEPNYVASGAILAVGIILIFMIFARKKKDKPDLYSFK